MSLRINHNLAALNAHRNLVDTENALNKSMQRLSSGFRINQGSDNPAGLVISEQFRAQIAGLNRAVENSEGSINMIQTAEGALTEINNLLVSMRELAIHAANEGFNDADQLAADQAEITNAITTIDRIAVNTQFGTKKLLDGTKENVASISSSNASGLTVRSSALSTGSHYVTSTKAADPTATLNVSTGGFALAGTGDDGDPYNLAEKIYAVNVVQASGAATKNSESIDVVDDWGNGIQFRTTGHAAVMASALAMATADAATTFDFSISFQESGDAATGYINLSVAVASGDHADALATAFNTALLGTALEGKVTASANGAGDGSTLNIKSADEGAQYSMSWHSVTATGGTNVLAALTASDDRGKSLNTFDLKRITASQSDSSNVTVTLASGTTVTTMAGLATALNTQLLTNIGQVAGASTASDVYAEVWDDNKIRFATRDQGSAYWLQFRRTGASTEDIGNVLALTSDAADNTGQDALITLDGHSNSIDKVDYDQITNYTLEADSTSTPGTVKIAIDANQQGLGVGSYLLDVKATKFDVTLDGGAATRVTAGQFNTIYNADRSESLVLSYSLISNGGTETVNNIDQSLVFQIGANVGQTAKISLRNMAATSLGKNLASNTFANLSEIDVTTADGAQNAQAVIDAAINEVSTTRGTLGSFQKNTLESNLRNLRIAAQNLTASESMIRDTDMASEMSEFTKNQILVQAGMAMLGQANQIPQTVLSLFQ
jgi:flagellin